ncbi:hypothetical protein Slin15195_G107150 [Septoria linicola]|uniref:DUF6604 domain-containing protein n=1 Tax=Septoria linicola TaxID=215465 RepID=A0A9Q9B592_9PEZI|nr:hypothetical protein Slin15195_G107150 [Septoria linicola]
MAFTPICARHRRFKLQQNKLERWMLETASKVLHRSSGNKHQVSAKLYGMDMIELAELIAKARPKVKVPQDTQTVIANVIYDRTVTADIFTKFEKAEPDACDGQLPERNRTHRAFIRVLTRVRDLLLSLLPAVAKNLGKQKQKDESSNIFDLS